MRAGTAAAATSGPVIVESDTGARVSGAPVFVYRTPGTIATVAPAQGQRGTIVTISGTELLGGGAAATPVTLGETPVLQIVSSSSTAVVVRAGASSNLGLGNVTVESDTGAVVQRANAWTYANASVITSVTPSSGHAGTFVTITGDRLYGVGGPVAVTSVTLAGRVAQVVSAAANTIVVRAQNSSAAVGNVEVVAQSGAISTATNAWTYVAPGVITQVDPNNGRLGTRVSITGSNLLGGGASAELVTLAGTNVSSVVSSTNSLIVVIAADADPTVGDVVVVANTGATVSLADGFTYGNASRILSVSPVQGQQGTLVTITGSLMRGGGTAVTNVTLVGVPARIVSEADAKVVVQAGFKLNNASVTGDVVVTSDSGAIATLANSFTYLPANIITSVTPASGQEGTFVTVRGLNLLGGGTVVASAQLAGINATVLNSSDTLVLLRAGPGPSSITKGDVVLTADSGAVVTDADAFTYLQPGDITLVTPTSGQVGTVVTIFGSLCGGGSAVAKVQLADFPATIDRQQNCQLVVVIAQDYGANVTGDVVVESDTGALVTEADAWSYIAAGVITDVSHSAGQAGTRITIQGSTLFGGGATASQVTLAGVPASIVGPNNNDSYIVVQANTGPANGQPRTGDIVITGNTAVSVRKVGAWSYSVIDSVSPSSGQRGTNVTITGTSLLASGQNPTSVTLAGVAAAAVLSFSDTEVVVAAAPNVVLQDQTGLVVITLDNGQQVTTAQNAFTYKAPGSITAVAPAQGQAGALVTIDGTQLFGYGASAISVKLAGVQVDAIVSQSASRIVVRAGESGATSGAVTIVADTAAVVERAGAWTYVAVANITAVAPSTGQVGTRVTISGTGLLNGAAGLASATLAGVSVEQIVSATNAQVIVVAAAAPPSNASGPVLLTSRDGATVAQDNAFAYLTAGAVDSVTPASGQVGTVVTIRGSNLLGGATSLASVTLNNVSATLIAANDTLVLVSANSGAGFEGVGHVVLTAATGARTSAQNSWTYLSAGAIATVAPASGQFGTRVALQGTNLLGGGTSVLAVTLAGIPVE